MNMLLKHTKMFNHTVKWECGDEYLKQITNAGQEYEDWFEVACPTEAKEEGAMVKQHRGWEGVFFQPRHLDEKFVTMIEDVQKGKIEFQETLNEMLKESCINLNQGEPKKEGSIVVQWEPKKRQKCT